MKKELYCSLEEFQAMKKKAFRNIPRSLLINVLEELPDYASIVYLRLYDLTESNSKHTGTVIISYSALGQKLKKSESSIKRAVKELKEKGYIEIVQQGAKNKKYLPNIIRVLCPQNVAQEIMKEEDRKLNVLKFPVKNSGFNQLTNLNKTSSLEKCYKSTSDELTTEPKDDRPEPIVSEAFLKHEQIKESLQEKGVSGLRLAQETRKFLTSEELIEFDNYMLSNSKKTISDFSFLEKPKMDREEVKNDLHKINNRDQQSLMLTIDKAMEDNTIENFLASLWDKTIVSFEKETSIVTSKLSELENKMIESKLRAMHKYKEIHHDLEKLSLNRLVAEVKYHVIYRDITKTPTVKHALNAAAAMLRQGTWSTPKRLASFCTNQMESAIKYLKRKEIMANSNNSPVKTERLLTLSDLLRKGGDRIGLC